MQNVDKKWGFVLGILIGAIGLIVSVFVFYKMPFEKISQEIGLGAFIFFQLLLFLLFWSKKYIFRGILAGYFLMIAAVFLVAFIADLMGPHAKSF